jgi:DNA-binding beta-propeller fold protein YncE
MKRLLLLSVVLITPAFARAEKIVVATSDTVQPFAIDFDKEGNIYFVEMNGGERLKKLFPDGKVEVLAGTGKKGLAGDGGDASKAEFNGMHNLAVAPDGKIYLADTFNNAIRKYDPASKKVEAFAGTGKKAYSGDGGPAAQAEFNQAICIALTTDGGTLFIADIGNKRVRAINTKTGTVTTVAGTGKAGVPKDGELAKDQPLVDPRAVAVDAKGNLYILERGGHALRVVDKEGKIKTVAGTGKAGKGGDGGPALAAAMNGPKFLSIDPDGSVLIADTENHQIRRYIPGKEVMELVAGKGTKGNSGVGGDPKMVEMARPHGVSVHPNTGEMYIADSDNNRVLKIVK